MQYLLKIFCSSFKITEPQSNSHFLRIHAWKESWESPSPVESLQHDRCAAPVQGVGNPLHYNMVFLTLALSALLDQ